jgi:hypothetical protein
MRVVNWKERERTKRGKRREVQAEPVAGKVQIAQSGRRVLGWDRDLLTLEEEGKAQAPGHRTMHGGQSSFSRAEGGCQGLGSLCLGVLEKGMHAGELQLVPSLPDN